MKKNIYLILALCLLPAALGLAGSRPESAAAQAPAAAADFASQALSSEQLASLIERKEPDFHLVDVRTDAEYRAGAIPTAVNIPYDQIGSRPPTQDKNARIIVYCRSGNRSGQAKTALEALGYRNVNDFGAVGNWKGELIRR